MKIRVLYRTIQVDEKTATVEIVGIVNHQVGFHQVQVDIASLGSPLDTLIAPDYRFHAVAEVENDQAKSLSDFECDGRTIEEQAQIIDHQTKILIDKLFHTPTNETACHLILSFAPINDEALNRLEKKNEPTST